MFWQRLEGLMSKDLAEGVALLEGRRGLASGPVCSLDVGRKKCVYPGRWWPEASSETSRSGTWHSVKNLFGA